MEQELEMAIQPNGNTGEKAPAERRPDIERNISIASDGRTRSKFQMFCIVTALFVSPFPSHLINNRTSILTHPSI